MKLSKMQEVVYKILDEGLEMEVGDFIDEETSLPFVFLGEIEKTPFNTKTSKGKNIKQTIYTFSQFDGKEECFEIVEDIESLLSQEMEIKGFFVISNEVTRTRVEEVENNLIQGLVEIEIVIEEDE